MLYSSKHRAARLVKDRRTRRSKILVVLRTNSHPSSALLWISYIINCRSKHNNYF
jgi:hypothetical protein